MKFLSNYDLNVSDLDLVSEAKIGAHLSGIRNGRSGRWRKLRRSRGCGCEKARVTMDRVTILIEQPN